MSKIIFTSWSAPFFSNYLSKICKGKHDTMSQLCGPKGIYQKESYNFAYKDKNVFVVGLYHPEHPRWKNLKSSRCIIMFAGGDIVQLKNMEKSKREDLFRILEDKGIVWVAESELTQKEIMRDFGLKTELIHLPSPHKFKNKIVPFPKKFTISCYIFRKNYYYHFLREVIKRLPSFSFILYNLKGISPVFSEVANTSNIKYYNKPVNNMPKFLSGISCGLRMMRHDTYSMTAIEHNLAGRWFINNHSMPYCEKISYEPTVDEVVDVIQKVRQRKDCNEEGFKFYSKNHSWEIFRKRVRELFKK